MNTSLNTTTDIRYMPSYSVPEAAFYLRLPVSTLRAWIGRRRDFAPLIIPAQERPLSLSFINLIEAYVLASIRRKHEISMAKVRKGLSFISSQFGSRHPLADGEFETDGIDLFLREADVVYNQEGQIVLADLIKQYLKRIERDTHGLPIKLYPFSGRGEPDEPKFILIDPKISFGRPMLARKGIPVEIVAERYRAGESIDELRKDYECSQEEIEEALRCRLWKEAA